MMHEVVTSIRPLAVAGAVAALRRRPPLGRDTRNIAGIVTVVLSATTLSFVGVFNVSSLVSPGIAAVVANIQPILGACLAWKVLNERLPPVRQLGLDAARHFHTGARIGSESTQPAVVAN